VPNGVWKFVNLFYNQKGEWREGVARPEFSFLYLTLKANGMINNSAVDKWNRINQKQLNQLFINELIEGLQCSPFEAKAILDTVHKVFDTYFLSNGSIKPGQIQTQCAAIENSAKVKLADCRMVTVTLTLDAGNQDLNIRKEKGIIALRRHRLERICNEAYQQGGVLTVEDLSCRLFNCGERTIVRDIRALKDQGIFLPLRSTIKDMGRSISHREQIIKHWLKGKEYHQIARDTKHSIEAIQNYVNKFQRVIALAHQGYDIHTIGFLVKISSGLAEAYYRLYTESEMAQHRADQLADLLERNDQTTKKKF
jgi:hypothetical protein